MFPEIPVNIYDLGLIYKIDLNGNDLEVDMTLTAPNCPAADFIAEDVKQNQSQHKKSLLLLKRKSLILKLVKKILLIL